MSYIEDDAERIAIRVDRILSQRAQVLLRITPSRVISVTTPKYDRLGRLSLRVDYWQFVYGRYHTPVLQRVSVRISEIHGGFSFTRFWRGTATDSILAPSFNETPTLFRAIIASRY